ncbi:MAG: glycosyltransferase family 2 protein [Pseudomonadales bacterium]
MAHISIVIPVFNEQAVLPTLVGRLRAVFDAVPEHEWRACFVDDGSQDGSAAIIEDLIRADARFSAVVLSRNFGHQSALTAGIAQVASADAVVTMDADLQDPPELIPALVKAWEHGAEIVLAVRRSRQERGIRRLGFELFHRLFWRLTDHPIEPNTGTFGLLARPAVDAFVQLPEQHRFFPGLRAWVGFTQGRVEYDRLDRVAGPPAQTFRRLLRYALDGIFSFSRLPLRLLTYTGLVTALVGFSIGAFFAVRRIVGSEIAPTGFTTIVTVVLLLGGIQLIGIGVIGEYLGRVYDEVKRRPPYIVRRVIGRT